MKKGIIVFIFSFLCALSFGQNREEADKLVDEGISIHDAGDFEGAIEKYDKALQFDQDNLRALGEKAMSLIGLKKYKESIQLCEKAIKTHPGEKGLKFIYVNIGNSYDGLKKTKKALEFYDEGIKQFPDYYQLHFNKAITLTGIKEYDEAIISCQKAIALNPDHASSHNTLARLLYITDKKIPSLLAYSRFLVLESQSNRANENLNSLQKIMKGNAKKTGVNSITININSVLLDGSNDKSKENNFSSVELILAMDAALDYDKKNRKNTEVENFIRKFESICAILEETKKDNSGFYWDYYVPYFIEIKEKELIKAFSYTIFLSSDDKTVSKWLESHKNETNLFHKWSKAYEWGAK
ncbi:MAG: tetratricopeptide repeat protein [Cyclobacteriaceae bacterium]|nr:tetratricopeptide repeat protein [Cyclobacteriaceae bacterium]